jgi:hypothetical protein
MAWTHQDFEELRKDWSEPALVGWKLIYADGSEIRSTDMPFDAAPQYGVLILIKYYRRPKGGHSREIQNGHDFYVLRSGRAESFAIPPQIKAGKNVSNRRFDDVLRRARADPEIVVGMTDADVYRNDHRE